MAIRIESATLAHFPAVLDTFLRRLNPRLSEAVWRRLFVPHWGIADRPLGSVMFDGDRVVGYAAYIHASLPRPAGPDEALCNVSTWITDPAYAAQALAVMMPALTLRDTTVTNLTPLPAVHEIFLRLGFKTLESRALLLRPAPFTRGGWPRGAEERDPERIRTRLPAWEARVADDHTGLAEHLWIEGPGGRHCYVVYAIVRRRRLPAARILWITPGALPDASLALRRALWRAHGAVLVELGERWADGVLPAAHPYALQVPRLYRSSRLTPAEVPSAYSELTLLGV